MTPTQEDSARAIQILRGASGGPDELFALGLRLKDEKKFGLAWRIFELIPLRPGDTLGVEAGRQRADCLANDPDLPPDERLDTALAVLANLADLDTTTDSDTLAIAGDIHRRKWEDDSQRANLEKALGYYLRGHQPPDLPDHGHCGVHAAFLLDAIGVEELEHGGDAQVAAATQRFHEADETRREVLHIVGPHRRTDSPWSLYATLAEACAGLRRFDELETLLAEAPVAATKEWEIEATVRQIAAVARALSRRMHDPAILTRTEQVLRSALGLSEAAVRSAFVGKVGLALSGGGFRASLFHIGVFARLAELDLLRHVEVLSCVSGGSIVGASYYLKLRELLQTKEEAAITREDYVTLVQQMADEFLKGVQKNIRTRVIGSFRANLRMIWSDSESRTERAGELYEKYLYRDITGDALVMRKLLIAPKGEGGNGRKFEPKVDNWRRNHKVPVLLLNATSLNTGHQWQFTARSMGEPPQRKSDSIDAVYRLRRMRYVDAPEKLRDIPLGTAVGASAAVPGLFEPIVFKGLYPLEGDAMTVRLCDGGVHDNQGVATLLEQSCKVVFVSDASGQMAAEDNPPNGILGVVMRADSVLQARLREAQYRDLAARRRAGQLQGAMFIHLTKELTAPPVNWVGCDWPKREVPPRPLTSYGVDRDVQRQIAQIRTDLDSFSDAEAYALMTSGYLMTRQAVTGDQFPTLPPLVEQRHTWGFLGAQRALDGSDRRAQERMRKLLAQSDRLVFKVWHQAPALKVLGAILVAALIVGAAAYAYVHRDASMVNITWGAAGITVLGFVATMLGFGVLKYLNVRSTVKDAVTGLAVATLGFVAAWIHLLIFDPLFLKLGRWEKAQPEVPPPGLLTDDRIPIAAPRSDGHAAQERPSPSRLVIPSEVEGTGRVGRDGPHV
jgi:predicted acylesterase/phospholipase RssA